MTSVCLLSLRPRCCSVLWALQCLSFSLPACQVGYYFCEVLDVSLCSAPLPLSFCNALRVILKPSPISRCPPLESSWDFSVWGSSWPLIIFTPLFFGKIKSGKIRQICCAGCLSLFFIMFFYLSSYCWLPSLGMLSWYPRTLKSALAHVRIFLKPRLSPSSRICLISACFGLSYCAWLAQWPVTSTP